MIFDDAIGRETPMQAFRRRMRWRKDDAKLAHVRISRAKAWNRGQKRVGCVPVYEEDASEANIQSAIRLLNHASWRHHQ